MVRGVWTTLPWDTISGKEMLGDKNSSREGAILLWVVDYLSTTSPSMGSSLSEDLEPDDLLESSDLASSEAAW